MSVTQLALPERSALAIGVPGEPGSSGPAGADGALYRISGREQLNLSGMGAEGGSPLSLRERNLASEIRGDRLQQLAVRWAERSVGLVERALRLAAFLQGGRKRRAFRPAIRIKRG